MPDPNKTRFTNPQRMLKPLRSASERKLRLFACACARRVWGRLRPPYRATVEAAERCAEGEVKWWDARRIEPASGSGRLSAPARMAAATMSASPWLAADFAAFHATPAGVSGRDLCALLHDIFGPPESADPAWLTPTALALARAAYDERELPGGTLDPLRLAVLADALQDAGADGLVLSHLRYPGTHVRGCWAVDLVLGLG